MLPDPDPVQLTYQQLEQETARLICVMATCNPQIGSAIIANLRDRVTPQELAGMVLVGLERLIWLDSNAFLWAIEHLIPADVKHEIQRLMVTHIGKQLVDRGFMPGQDFSLDSAGRLLLSEGARATVAHTVRQTVEREQDL